EWRMDGDRGVSNAGHPASRRSVFSSSTGWKRRTERGHEAWLAARASRVRAWLPPSGRLESYCRGPAIGGSATGCGVALAVLSRQRAVAVIPYGVQNAVSA